MNKFLVWIKSIFLGLYKKPLIKLSDLEKSLKKIDKNKDNSLSANEIWDAVIELLSKKK